jgi:hypothetical protein
LATKDEQGLAVIDVVEAAMKPLLPLFRNFGVTHHDLSQMLARLFVYDTEETLKKEGRPTTPARLALMTGLTRGEAERYLADRVTAVSRRSKKNAEVVIPSTVLTVWNFDSRFSTPYQVALDLDLKPSNRRRSFIDLVETAAPGADPDAVLDQLLAAGCVEVHDQIFVRCTNRAYIPAGVSVERITRIGTALGALAGTLTHNLLETSVEEDGFIERTLLSDFPVSPQGRKAIRSWIAVDGLRLFDTLDAWINNSRSELESQDGNTVGIEMFMFEVPKTASTPSEISKSSNW